jgi:hypothetical protein
MGVAIPAVLLPTAVLLWVIAVVSMVRFRRVKGWSAFGNFRKTREMKRYLELGSYTRDDYRRVLRAVESEDASTAARTYFLRFLLAVYGFIGVIGLTVGLSAVFD